MPPIPLRETMPYGSILMKVPQGWNEDPFAKELCVYYYPGAGGPPTFYVRRDDFIFVPGAVAAAAAAGEGAAGEARAAETVDGTAGPATKAGAGAASAMPAIGALDLFGDIDAMDEELFARFRHLVSAMDAPDLYFPKLEPRSPHGQMIRYLRHGKLGSEPGVAWWWVKGKRTGLHFTVASFCLEILAARYDLEETKQLVALFDREVSAAEILGLDDAVALHDAAEAAEAE